MVTQNCIVAFNSQFLDEGCCFRYTSTDLFIFPEEILKEKLHFFVQCSLHSAQISIIYYSENGTLWDLATSKLVCSKKGERTPFWNFDGYRWDKNTFYCYCFLTILFCYVVLYLHGTIFVMLNIEGNICIMLCMF